MVVATADVGIS